MQSLNANTNIGLKLAEHFAELCCASAILANQILQAFPDYRAAKANPADAFWRSRAPMMLEQVEQAERNLEHPAD